jgi:HK97 family phage portal protein
MQLAAVWRSITLVAELLSSMPVDTYRGSGRNKVEVSTPPNIVTKPSLRVTRREWVYQYVVSMMLRGQAIGVVLAFNETSGLPDVVEWVNPTCVSIVCPTSFDLPEYYVNGARVDRDRIIHVRNVLMPGCIEGLSPIEYHAETIGLGLAAHKFGAQWFGQGAHPSAILSSDQRIDEKQAESMKKRFVASIRKRREPAVLGSGITYTPIQINPEESQFLQTMGMNAAEIAMIFGVPPEQIGVAPIGDGASLTYANREQRWQDFIATCLAHYAVRLEDAWGAMTPRGQAVKLNFDAVLRGDTLSRYQAHQIGIAGHFLLPNEARELEDRPPVKGGDEFPKSDPPAQGAPA